MSAAITVNVALTLDELLALARIVTAIQPARAALELSDHDAFMAWQRAQRAIDSAALLELHADRASRRTHADHPVDVPTEQPLDQTGATP